MIEGNEFYLTAVGKQSEPMLLFNPKAERTTLPGIQNLFSALRDSQIWNYQGAPAAQIRENVIHFLESFYTPCASLLHRGGIISSMGQFCRAEVVGVPFLESKVYSLGQRREECKVSAVPDDKVSSDVFELGFLPSDLQPSKEVTPLLTSAVRVLRQRDDLSVYGVDKGADLIFVAPGFSLTLQHRITPGGGVIWSSVPTTSVEDLFVIDLEKALEARFKRLFDKAKLPRIVDHTATAIGMLLADCERSV